MKHAIKPPKDLTTALPKASQQAIKAYAALTTALSRSLFFLILAGEPKALTTATTKPAPKPKALTKPAPKPKAKALTKAKAPIRAPWPFGKP